MNVTDLELSPEKIAAIEQHKYFLSEKAGHDVGWEFAEQDWRSNFDTPEPSASEPSAPKSTRQDSAHQPSPKGVGGFFKRLLSRAASV